MAITPELHAAGVYSLIAPWSTAANTTYTCIAIRSFPDIAAEGVNIQAMYYVAMGLADGASYAGGTFNFAAEVARAPNIITLRDNSGNLIHVPDTFIASCPQLSIVPYSNTVLSFSLGAIPDFVDLTAIKAQIASVVAGLTGITPTVNTARAPCTNNPSYAQNIVLENARIAAITNRTTDTQALTAAQAQVTLLNATVASLTAILVANGLIP